MVHIRVSDKRKPTHDLVAFKTWARSKAFRVTGSAIRSSSALGFDRQGMVDVIQTMSRGHFRKSMTSHADHTQWQDVYHVPSAAGDLYVKFRDDILTEFLLLSFKERHP